jgi:hypothetical protein
MCIVFFVVCGEERQTGSVGIAEMAETGENSHGKNNLCKIRVLTINTDERPKTVEDALPSVQRL